jgi:hypothetical protein
MKLWTKEQQGEGLDHRDLGHPQVEQCQGRRISPVQILTEHKDGLPLGLCEQPRHQGFIGLLLLLFGRQLHGWIALAEGYGEEGSKQGHHLLQR